MTILATVARVIFGKTLIADLLFKTVQLNLENVYMKVVTFNEKTH